MPKRSITPEDLLSFHWLSDARVSPDGSRVLFSKGKINDKNKVLTNLWTVEVASGILKQWTNHETGSSMGRWAPDGEHIAFVAAREKSISQIYTVATGGGEAYKLTSLPEGSITELKWSPDGQFIAFTFRETHPDHTVKAKEEQKEKGLSPAPWEIDSLWYRLDGDGYFANQRYKILIADVANGATRVLYDKCPMGAYSYEWMADSSGLYIGHTVAKAPLLDAPNEQIFAVPLEDVPVMLPGLEPASRSGLTLSPDGKQLAYIGDTDQEFQWGCRNSRAYVVPIQGGPAVTLTENEDYCLDASTLTDTGAGSSAMLQWLPDGKSLRLVIGWHGTAQVAEIDVVTRRVSILTEGEHVLGGGTATKDGKVHALTIGNPTALAEIAVYEDGKIRTLTHFNDSVLSEIELSQPEEVWVPTTDGLQVQTWVMRPQGFNPSQAYPAILEVHGGPHTQYGLGFFYEFQNLVAQGYVVVFSNPRGSKGYGEAWTSAIKGDWGSKDWDDVQAVTTWMLNQPYISKEKTGIMGGSYGGFMTNWAIGHSHVYKAAITDRCVFNWISMAGNSDFPLNKDGYFGGNAWGPLANLEKLWQQSPVSAFADVKTPTLIIHSEGDLRCNVEQGEQVFYVLKALGVEAKFIRYPSVTSHGMSRNGPPDMRIHRVKAIMAWWAKHLA